MHKKKEDSAVNIAKKELKKEKIQKIIEFSLLYLALLSSFLLFIFLLSNLFFTGYASYVSSEGGYITEVILTHSTDTFYWGGIYGLSVRFPEFTEQLYEELSNGEISRKDLFFDCIEEGAEGGTEVYASTFSGLTEAHFSEVEPATSEAIDDFIGCSGEIDCASNTFTQTTSFMIGTTNITDVPSTHTFRYDGTNNIFDLGALNVSGYLVFGTHRASMQRGYSPNVTVNFQLLLPVPPNTTQTYYFYTDPFDTCPAGGGIGELINATVFGYVTNTTGDYLADTSVSVAGQTALSDNSGFYNLSFAAVTGTYNLIGQKSGYQPYISNVSINFTSYDINKDIMMIPEPVIPEEGNETVTLKVYGSVTDGTNYLSDARVYLGDNNDTSNSSGHYSFYTSVLPGHSPIIAIKSNYDNYYYILEVESNTTEINHDIVMSSVVEQQYTYPTGPYTQRPVSQIIAVPTLEQGEDYWISTKEIRKEVRQNTFIEEIVSIYNFKGSAMNLYFELSPELRDFVKLDKDSMSVPTNLFGNLFVTIYGTKPVGEYNGTLTVSGDVEEEIPIYIKVVERRMPIETLLMEIGLFKRTVSPGSKLKYKLNLQNLLQDQNYKIFLRHLIVDNNNTQVFTENNEEVEISNALTLLKEIEIPEDTPEGEYLLKIDASYLYLFSSATSPFIVAKPIYLYSVFGIPLWLILLIIAIFSFIFLNFFLYKRYKERKKRYRVAIDFSTLPKEGTRSLKLGLIAETKVPAYLELERLTTHTIVAGATGMGKSISAQDLIEEALLKDIAVVVFDPTAQWSGMLRKCTDKKMFAYYPKFGMKEQDARGFKGNIRQVKNARQVIDIKKYINPGQIQIFTLNKLDPKDIDMFVANVIRQVFKGNPQESPNLKVLIVFDEVHRLLSKFGGSGEGFIQIERACREFRKWGLGLILISQVLSDFVGEVKANINTEIQTRTIEESDLNRIKTKYGEEFLRSLVKAEVGVAMFQNAEYNRGKPYFINFRPILHNTRRLSDEELDKYNQYNDIIDDIEYQIEQLEQEKIDTFDLKMELKLVKDKLMTGNFAIVDIYLEGLKPRLEQQWTKLGKKPKKRDVELVAEEEIKKSIEEAKKARKEFEKEEKDKEEKTEKKPEKKEDVKEKQIKALTFDNGIMVSSVNELIGVLPNLDEEIFKLHINKEKNDIASWLKQLSPELESKFKNITDKSKMTEQLKNIDKLIGKSGEGKKDKGKGKSKEKQEEKEQDKTKKQDKKQETQKTTKKASKKQAKTKSKKTKSDKKTKKK